MDQLFQFSELFGRKLGIWRVHLSAQALRDFLESSYEGNFENIKKKLVQLASGYWKRKSLVLGAGNSYHRQKAQRTLHEIVYGPNRRILWQVDVDFDEDSNNITQVVKVWRIGERKEVNKAINIVLHIQKNYSVSRMAACKQTKFEKSSGRNLPIEFTDHSVLKLEQKASVESVEFDYKGERALESNLLSNKFYALTETVVDNIFSKKANVEYPLTVSEEELHVIKNSKSSTLVSGMNGTGKTTCLVYKLVGRYLAIREIQRGKPLRQILLTRSPLLAAKLGSQTKCLIDFQSKNITDKIKDDIWASIGEVTDAITSLKDEDFPLVCTFDHFLKLLENTIRYADREQKDFPAGNGRFSDSKNDHQMPDCYEHSFHSGKSQNVSFQIFKNEYWRTFPHQLTNKFSEASAFMEIMGVIKGSASAETQFKPLSREEYKTKGFESAPTFFYTSERDRLYDIYERYERKKRERQALDDIDRVISIFRAISTNEDLKTMVGEALDKIYVDEVQDLRVLEIELLINLIKDPRGIHFAGDTAQCISKDSILRFEDVQALLCRKFSRLRTIANAPELARPEFIKLNRNFRAHQGILAFASFVIKLLWTEFPAMVDKLPPEIGQYLGPKPTIFVNFGSFFSSLFQSVELRSRAFDFGAEQVIIVRDNEDKERLRDDIGQNGNILILTILESKGMEFDDVFLVDFFTSSECRSSFRALARSGNTDGLKDMTLCTELKQLYVAITRPRSRLWLFESDPSSITSFVELLKREPGQPLVDIVHMNEANMDENVKRIAQQVFRVRTIHRQDWSTRAREYLHRQDYENAKLCSERAEDEKVLSLAEHFTEEQRGKIYRALGKEVEFEKFSREFSKLFRGYNLAFKEATCPDEPVDFKKAAVIFSKHGKYEQAASLFELAECYEEASDNYVRSGNYDKGADVLHRGSLFEELVCYLNKHRDFIDSDTQFHESRLCNLVLKQKKISSYLEAMTVEAIGSDLEQETFHRDHGMTEKLKDFNMAKKRYSELFDMVIENEGVENAWSFVDKYNLSQKMPQKYLAEILNYVQSKSLGERLSSESKMVLAWNEEWYPIISLIPKILEICRPWQQLARVLNDYQDGRIDCANIRFEESWMKGLFSIIVTIKAAHFIAAAKKISELPIEFINEVTDMVKLMATEGKIASSLLIFLGIFPFSEKSKICWLLDWSPLNSDLDGAAGILDTTAVVDKARKWALDRLHPAITQIHNKVSELEKIQYPQRCHSYLSTSSCRNIQRGICELTHTIITKEEYSNFTKDLLRMVSVYNTFGLLCSCYRRRPDILGKEFAESFNGHRILTCLRGQRTSISLRM